MRGSKIERRLVYVWGTMQENTIGAWKTSLQRPEKSEFLNRSATSSGDLFVIFELFHEKSSFRCQYTYYSLPTAKSSNSTRQKPGNEVSYSKLKTSYLIIVRNGFCEENPCFVDVLCLTASYPTWVGH